MKSPNDLVEHVRLAQDIDTTAHDIGADLLADGCTLSEIARVLDRSRQTATDRFVVVPGPRELERAVARAQLYLGRELHGVRVTSWDRFVVFHDGDGWRVLRHVQDPDMAATLAEWLGQHTQFRYNKRPRDIDGAVPWRFPLGRNHDKKETGR